MIDIKLIMFANFIDRTNKHSNQKSTFNFKAILIMIKTC